MGKRIKIKNLLLKESVIDEDFNSQNILEQLNEDIVKNFFYQYVKKTLLIRKEPEMFTCDVFKGLSYKYGDLNKFVNEFTLYFKFSNIKEKGFFQPLANNPMGSIYINLDPKIIYHAFLDNYNTAESEKEIATEMYYQLVSGEMKSVILHELQHAYDYYISGGKFTSDKSSKDFYAAKRRGVANDNPKNKDRMRVKYLRLKHEVNARFSQTVHELNTHGLFNHDTNSFIELNQYLNDFKYLFLGWELMTPKIQKYLVRRASQYYYKYKEEFEKEKKGE